MNKMSLGYQLIRTKSLKNQSKSSSCIKFKHFSALALKWKVEESNSGLEGVAFFWRFNQKKKKKKRNSENGLEKRKEKQSKKIFYKTTKTTTKTKQSKKEHQGKKKKMIKKKT